MSDTAKKAAGGTKQAGRGPRLPGAWGSRLLIRGTVSLKGKIILGVIPILAILAAWTLITWGEAEARMISPLILPSPLEVVRSIPKVWLDLELSRSIVASLRRVVLGFGAAVIVAFPLGLAMGSFGKVRALFEPLSLFASYLPIPALVPLTMSLFGTGEAQKVMFLALAFFIYLLPLFLKSVDGVDNVYLQTAYTLGATQWQSIRRVLLSISLPGFIQAMRLGFGVGWSYIILAEMVVMDKGLGQIILVAQRRAHPEQIYFVLLVIVLIAYLTDRLWKQLYKSLFPYLEAR